MSADLQRSPFFTVDDWRSLFGSLFDGQDKRDDADIFARYLLLLREALDRDECQVVKTSLKSAMLAVKEFGRFAQIELDYYMAYLLGELTPDQELRFIAANPVYKGENRSKPRSAKKKRQR
ncbi:MAG: hypothetical protein J2P56_05025 [Verrucomicrobia bacterium]|nr:hypothetical protein [Verrucomicrobiota bacterium]